MKRGFWLAGTAAAALIAGAPAPARAAPLPLRPAIAPEGFDARVAAAKSAMMADPGEALRQSLAALAAARAETAAGRDEHLATAQWLQAEALLRLRRPTEAGPIVETALATAAAKVPNSKLLGDLTSARAKVAAARGQAPPRWTASSRPTASSGWPISRAARRWR